MPKVSEEHMEARRAQVIAAAIACFAEKGFHKTSMKEICERAMLSPGAVYNYFESKDEIIASVMKSSQYENRSILQKARIVGNNMNDQVELALSGSKKMLKGLDVQTCIRADIMFAAEALTNAELAELGTENYNSIMEHLLDLTQQWQKKGWINQQLQPEALAQVLFSCVQGLSLQLVINPKLDLDAYFASVKALFTGQFISSETD